MLKAIVAVAFLWTQAALPADRADWRVAEWVLYMGGNVRLAGDPRTIQDLSELPAGDFRLESVDLIGAHSLDAIDLAKLSPLQDLKGAASSRTDREPEYCWRARDSTAAM